MGRDTGVHREERVILCIDDDAQILQVLRDFLTSFGYRVLIASNPEETLQMFLNRHVDAVVTDYKIGEATARDVILSLQALNLKIPIILFSGTDDLPQELVSLVQCTIHKTEIGILVPALANLLNRRSDGGHSGK